MIRWCKTMFTAYFGQTARARLLDFLGDHPASDYSITDIAAQAGMTRPTAYRLLDDLVEVGLVLHTRDVGQSRMYRLNTAHPVVRGILKADMAAAREEARLVPAHGRAT